MLTKSMTNDTTALKTFLKYLVPCMFAMALVAVYSFTDTFVVGRKLGAIALGAMGICTPVLTVTYAFGFMFGIGGGCLYSIFKGQKNDKASNSVFTTSTICMLAFAMLLALVGNLFIEPFARLLGADNQNIAFVLPYLRCLLCYLPGFMLDQLMSCYMRNDGHPNVAMAAIVTGTVMNVILDFLFVFGFDWGMFGAAFATCLCSFLTIIVNVAYAIWKKLNIRINMANFDIRYLWRIVKNGFSVLILESSSGIVTFVFILKATSLYGTLGASIYTIILNWSLITVNLVLGITQAAQPLISLSYGAEEYSTMYKYRKYSIVAGLMAGVAFLVIGYTLTSPLVSVFVGDDNSLVAETVSAMRLYLPAYFVMSIGICIGIYYQAVESAAKSLVIMIMRGIALPVLGIILLPLLFGKTGLWLAVPIAEAITAVAAVIYIFSEKRRKTANVVSGLTAAPDAHKHLVITISRQFGSGGRMIGLELSKILGWPLYDKQVSELTSELSGYDEQVIRQTEYDKQMPLGLFAGHHYQPISQQIYLSQSNAITHIAQRGPCIIVGRCAADVLRDKCPTFDVFIHAPIEQRIARVQEYEHCNREQAIDLIQESDHARSEYHDFFTHHEWGKLENYDLTIDSSIGYSTSADAIALCVNEITSK